MKKQEVFISEMAFTIFFQIWYVVFPSRRAPLKQIWYHSDKGHEAMNAPKF